MTISYAWLKEYLSVDLPAEEVAELLTDLGLEVENISVFETVKGGLEGVVTAHVTEVYPHPDADRLKVTKVDAGGEELLQIVCGAPNVAAGQKVVVALVDAVLYPDNITPLKIKKAKIRGVESHGMICAEDELGLGKSHDGILVLPDDVPTGMKAADYFSISSDTIFEIGLTPNRTDAMSHVGVARDLAAVLNLKHPAKISLPEIPSPDLSKQPNIISVRVEDPQACPRYSGVVIQNIKVSESPAWLKNRLLSIGLTPLNNVVDVTNFVLHELGQPLHAFDLSKIEGKQIIVKKMPEGTAFTTLDNVERKLTSGDLMICDAKKPLCIAGVYGGSNSGVTEETTAIFLESALFDPATIRKTARQHVLSTDASFRFERGTDVNMVIPALFRAASLIAEIAGGEIAGDLQDHYPKEIVPQKISFSISRCNTLIGDELPRDTIKNILTSLEFRILAEEGDILSLEVPTYRVEVTRQADVVEEVLRVYGYNTIRLPEKMNISLSHPSQPDEEKLKKSISEALAAKGFYEILNNSLTASMRKEKTDILPGKTQVNLLNPLSSALDAMRQTLLFGGLDVISFNKNRKSEDLKLFEWGNIYWKEDEKGYLEDPRLMLFLTGRKNRENWNSSAEDVSFYDLKAAFMEILFKLGISGFLEIPVSDHAFLSSGLKLEWNGKVLLEAGRVKSAIASEFDLKKDIYVADIHWKTLFGLCSGKNREYREISRYPAVRRDLSLLLNKEISYAEIENTVRKTEPRLLKEMGLFDVYEGKNLEEGKKSYALYFILQDENKTLQDKQIDFTMNRIQTTLEKELGAIQRM